jgi:hypothetical protein
MRYDVPLDEDRLRLALSPTPYHTIGAADHWIRCGRAAVAAVRVCCHLSTHEISHFRRANWLAEKGIVRVVDSNAFYNRDIPMLGAARVVVERYLNAMPFKDSRYLFVTPKGKRFDVSGLFQTMNLAGDRFGVPQLMGQLGATFARTVNSDPVHDGAAQILMCQSLKAFGLGDAPTPSFERLAETLTRHPLASHGDIAFFQVGGSGSPLLARIRACTGQRTLSDERRKALRASEFPEAFELFEEHHAKQDQIGWYFGLTHRQTVHWFDHHRVNGGNLPLPRKGALSEEWRSKVLRLRAERSVESFRAFHEHLLTLGFPWKKATLSRFMNSVGERSVFKDQTALRWGDAIERAYDDERRKTKSLPTVAGLHKVLAGNGFPHHRTVLSRHLTRVGLKFAPRLNDGDWAPRLAKEARRTRPRTYREFHVAMTKLGYPLTVAAMTRKLRTAGIELSPLAPGGRRFG